MQIGPCLWRSQGWPEGATQAGARRPPGPGRPCLAPAASQRLLSACCVAGVHLDSEGAVGESEQPQPHGASDLGL